MLKKISFLIKTLKTLGYHSNSPVIMALASISYPDQDEIVAALKSKFNLDDSKSAKVSKFLAIKNLSLIDPEESENESRKNEAASAERMAESFLRNNSDLKQELEEADKLWNSWKASGSLQANYNSPQRPMTPEDFVNQTDTTGIHADLNGARPGFQFSIPGIPLTSDKQPKNFHYLSPIDEKGNLMDVDEFFSHYIKMGVVPIFLSQVGSIFYEKFLNTAEDIFDMDEFAVQEYIGLMKMEESAHLNAGGSSRFFSGKEAENPYDENPDDEDLYEEKVERYRLKQELENLKSLVGETKKSLLGAKEQARISRDPIEGVGATQTAVTNTSKEGSDDILSIISYVFGLGPMVKTNLREYKDAYNLIYSDLSGFYILFKSDKNGWEKIAKFIAENNMELFISLRLYRIYKPEEFEFSEKALEKSVESRNGLNIFYKAKLWKELPPHFLELAAEKDPYAFFKSEIFESGQASDRAINIASTTLINHYAYSDSNLANYWIGLDISSKVPRSHFDSIIKLLAEQDPVRFLAWTSKDGKRLSDFYPEEKETAEERFLDIAKDLPHEDPIAFFSPPFPGGKKLWADYYAANNIGTMEEGISIAIETAKSLIQKEGHRKEGMIFSANWMKAGLSDFPRLDEVTRLAVNILIKNLQSFEEEYGYDTSLDGAEEQELNDLKEYFNKAIKNPSKVRFSDYDDKANIPVITAKIKEYMDRI